MVVIQFVKTNRYHGTFRAIPKSEGDQLDALRGLSAFGVILGHANQFIIGATTDAGNIAGGLLAQGSVMIFFVLSGLLIGKSVSRNIEASGGDGFNWLKYATDRAWRIYPPLLFALTLMALIWMIAPAVFPSGTNQYLYHTPNYGRLGINLDWSSVRATLIFRNGFSTGSPDMNGPLWSLSVEVWYYIIAGGVVALIRRPLLLLLFVALVWHLTHRNADFTDFAVVWFAGYGLCIAHNCSRLDRRVLALGFAVSTAFASVFGFLFAYPEVLSSQHSWIRYYNVAIGLAAIFVVGMILDGAMSLPSLIVGPFKRMAGYSYTLYLIHVPLFLILFGIFEPQIVGDYQLTLLLAAGGIALACMTAMAAASIVENKKLLQSLLRFRSQRRAG